jgi:hypothetical protein
MNRIRRISFAASLTAIAFMVISFTTAVNGQAREDGGYVAPTQAAPFCVVEQPAKKPTEAAVAEPPKAAPAADGTQPNQEVVVPEVPPVPPLVVLPEMKADCAGGKIKLIISARVFGWQVGDSIPLNIKFIVQDGSTVNLDPLRQGKIALEEAFKQSFELAGKPVIVTTKKDGVTTHDITIEVRQFTIKPHLRYTMQLPYSVDNNPDGTPRNQVFVTPEFVLLNNIDGGYENMKRPMTMGNTEMVKPRTAWLVPPLAIFVFLLFASWFVMAGVRYVNRVRVRKSISREAAAWLAMHSAVKSGKQIGFGKTHYKRMGTVVRTYLAPVYPGLEGMTLTEIEALPDEPQANLVKSMFRKLDRVLIEDRALSAAEQAQLLKEVDELIKRPYSM